MNKSTFVELQLNGKLIIRERTEKQLKRKLGSLNLECLFKNPKVSVIGITTNMQLPVGNIFEATL
ncbi:MAG: hypothetical protein ACI9T7_000055 [Oleiphilaceae bacterium]|jgi:hypothetical protein